MDGRDVLSGSKILVSTSHERTPTGTCGQVDTKSMDQVDCPILLSVYSLLKFKPSIYIHRVFMHQMAKCSSMYNINVFQDSVLSND